MPDIFRGIHLDPLVPANSFYLLWMILGYLVVSSVLIVSLGRLGDIYGRVRIYNLGFVIYTVASLLLAIDWLTGRDGADVPDRLPHRPGDRRRLPAGQLGGDHHRRLPRQPARAWRWGSTTSSASAGMFVGLVLGGLLAPIDWRLVFLISVPVGLFGTVWAYLKLEERSDAAAGADRLGGQRHLRPRPDPDHGRRHLRHPPLRRPSDRLGQPAGAGPAGRRRLSLAAFAVIERRVAGADVPAAAVPDPRVHLRHAVDVPLRGRARRPDVHADHLAAGDLAARSTATTSPTRRCGPGSTCCR